MDHTNATLFQITSAMAIGFRWEIAYVFYFYHTATLAIGYHADIHSIASVDDKHDLLQRKLIICFQMQAQI